MASDIDLSKLDQIGLKNLMTNAKRLGRADVYNSAFARLCEVQPGSASTDLSDVLVQKFWRAVNAAENLRSEETGKTARLSRTRQKVARDGVIVTMEAMALKPEPSSGFAILVRGGMPQFLFEYIILEHEDRFSSAAILASKRRFEAHKLAPPSHG